MLTHRHLLREVWGPNQFGQSRYLRGYVAHLREKLEANPASATGELLTADGADSTDKK